MRRGGHDRGVRRVDGHRLLGPDYHRKGAPQVSAGGVTFSGMHWDALGGDMSGQEKRDGHRKKSLAPHPLFGLVCRPRATASTEPLRPLRSA